MSNDRWLSFFLSVVFKNWGSADSIRRLYKTYIACYRRIYIFSRHSVGVSHLCYKLAFSAISKQAYRYSIVQYTMFYNVFLLYCVLWVSLL